MRIAVKYCGACNPQVDLTQIGRDLTALVQAKRWRLVSLEGNNPDVLVLLCGCSLKFQW
ncbi:MAG: hypothetical protein ABIH70_10020 [Chloroflexota bacterium]